MTINDQINSIHQRLIENPEYRKLLSARSNSEAVEGSLVCDNFLASQMIRKEAASMGLTEVGELNTAAIVKALNVVMRRYGMSRKQRLDRGVAS